MRTNYWEEGNMQQCQEIVLFRPARHIKTRYVCWDLYWSEIQASTNFAVSLHSFLKISEISQTKWPNFASLTFTRAKVSAPTKPSKITQEHGSSISSDIKCKWSRNIAFRSLKSLGTVSVAWIYKNSRCGLEIAPLSPKFKWSSIFEMCMSRSRYFIEN